MSIETLDMVGNTLHIGDKIIFHTKKFGSCFDTSTIDNIKKDSLCRINKQTIKADIVYFKQKRFTGLYTISKPSTEVIKLIREEDK